MQDDSRSHKLSKPTKRSSDGLQDGSKDEMLRKAAINTAWASVRGTTAFCPIIHFRPHNPLLVQMYIYSKNKALLTLMQQQQQRPAPAPHLASR
jgi:hypothetical protein